MRRLLITCGAVGGLLLGAFRVERDGREPAACGHRGREHCLPALPCVGFTGPAIRAGIALSYERVRIPVPHPVVRFQATCRR